MSEGELIGRYDGDGDNGLTDVLVLSYNRADGTFKIDGKVVNHEVALEMCGRAARHFETILRVQAAAAARQQMAQDAALAGIARNVVNGRH
jgi:hypothetical protein